MLNVDIPSLTTPTKKCPKCASLFVCQPSDVSNCRCSTVAISEATRIFLTKTKYDCLCNTCLEHFESLVQTAQTLQFPTQKEAFVEGLHYYHENGFWVFTELYHLLRGHCCGSGCRHCVYGFKKLKVE